MRAGIFGSYCQKKQTEHSIRIVLSTFFSHSGTTVLRQTVYRRLGKIALHVVDLSDVFHFLQLTVASGAEFGFRDDNAHPYQANIENECLQSEDITRMDWPEFSLDLYPVEHVWDILDRRVTFPQPPSTCL
ncbi:uncharacterized protein TNCV_2770891 [Trichonephila clavipes]|nr:uncharacterized protein TNCV_2770891 [Trichonephila clavipes]